MTVMGVERLTRCVDKSHKASFIATILSTEFNSFTRSFGLNSLIKNPDILFSLSLSASTADFGFCSRIITCEKAKYAAAFTTSFIPFSQP